MAAARLAGSLPHLELWGLHCQRLGSQIFLTEPYRAGRRCDAAPDGPDQRRARPGAPVPQSGRWFRHCLWAGRPAGARGRNGGPVGKGCRAGLPEIRAGAALCGHRAGPQRRVGPAGVTVYTVGGVSAMPGVRTYVAVDGGMPDNPRYALYGATSRRPGPPAGKRPRPWKPPSRANAAKAGIWSSKTPRSNRWRRAISCVCSPPARTITPWPPITTAYPVPRRWCSCGRASTAWPCAGRLMSSWCRMICHAAEPKNGRS